MVSSSRVVTTGKSARGTASPIPFHQNQFIRQLQRSQEIRESDADCHLARFSVER